MQIFTRRQQQNIKYTQTHDYDITQFPWNFYAASMNSIRI